MCYDLVAKDAMFPCSCRHRLLENKKNVKYRSLLLRMPQNLYDRKKNCIERVELYLFDGSVFTSRYLRLNTGTCWPSCLPGPLLYQYHMCLKSQCQKTVEIEQRF